MSDELDVAFFPGDSTDIVLVTAGIHSSEVSGIEVANWVKVKLAARPKRTYFSVVVVPEIFPERARAARTAQWKAGASADDDSVSGFREIPPNLDMTKSLTIKDESVKPARHFPPPGFPSSSLAGGFLLDRDGKTALLDDKKKKVPVLPQIRTLTRLIERVKPVRILTLHGKQLPDEDKLKGFITRQTLSVAERKARQADLAAWNKTSRIKWANWFGVYVDPRYEPTKCKGGAELERCKFDVTTDPGYVHTAKDFDTALTSDGKTDDQLDLDIASAVKNRDLVTGNHLDDPPAKVHYAKEGTGTGWSLGDWGPVDVKVSGDPGERPGAPVFTFEIAHYTESWAFLDGTQIMSESGKPLAQALTPGDRAAGKKPTPYAKPRLFDSGRSSDLQDYADAIIKVTLAKP